VERPWELLRERPVIRTIRAKENACRGDIERRDGKYDRNHDSNSGQQDPFGNPIAAEHFHWASGAESLQSSE
jgi:hypothetical protein